MGSSRWTSGIQVLGEHAYLASLEVIRENDRCLVHTAHVHSTSAGSVTAVVKCFPGEPANRGLINEVCGYLIARAAGLPVSDQAYVIYVSNDRLAALHPQYEKTITASGTDSSIVWATKTIHGPPFKFLYNFGNNQVSKRLMEWRDLPKMLAFDDWVGNADRSDDNLIEIHNGRFALIDHADIGGGIAWLADLLDPNAVFKNRVAEDLFNGSGLSNHIKSGMLLAAESHQKIFGLVGDELQNWLTRLMPRNQKDAQAFHRFLAIRASGSVNRVRQQTGLLL